jgi:flagella basal body P-ring formation protein FlgA
VPALHHLRKLIPAFCLGLLAIPAACAQDADGTNIIAQSVSAVLATAGVFSEASQIELPPFLHTTSLQPTLKVTAAELLPNGRLRVRFACASSRECQPFVATLGAASSQKSSVDLAALRKSIGSENTLPTVGATHRLLAGQHVTLLLEDDFMHIRVPALAIDSGLPGTEVRVSSLDRKQVFRGLVIDAATVRGTLP